MPFTQIIDAVERRRKTITVFSPDPPEGLRSCFESRHVSVEHEYVPDESEGFVAVDLDGELLGCVGLDAIRVLVRPPAEGQGELLGAREREEYRDLLRLLDDSVFSTFDRRQLLAAAHEIEDRAWRHGVGTLRAGFQRLSAMAAQREAYERLAGRAGLQVHVYGSPDHSYPSLSGIRFHPTKDPEIRDTWFVVFDSAGGDADCALLAMEHEPDFYYGFWIYDPDIVGDIEAACRAKVD